MTLHIRPADEWDIADIHDIECACFSTPWSCDAILGELQNGYSTLWVAQADGVTVGWAGLEAVCGEGDVSNIAVLPDYRRRGIGRALTATLLAACRERDLATLTLEVRVSNAAAISLYRSLGFCELGVRPGFYSRPDEDALMMRATISAR